MAHIRVGVLMGGKSAEKEVSFNSGRTICDHLDTTRYTPIPLFQRHDGALFILPYKFLHRGKITDFLDRLETEAQQVAWDDLATHIDFVYIATHGQYAEDGTLQGFLEVLGIPYLGSGVLSSALCMDKIMQKQVLRAHGIAVPRGIHVYAHEVQHLEKHTTIIEKQLHEQHLTPPLIVKPHKEGSSLGVHVVHSIEELSDTIKKACYVNQHKPQHVVIEEKIDGMEFSCIVLVNNTTGELLPLPPTEIVPEQDTHIFDYEQKYMPGRAHKHTPPRCSTELTKKIQDTCKAVMRTLNIRTIARVDGFVQKDGTIVIVDPNTLSGMGPASFVFREAAELNMGHADLINHLIETDLQAYGMLPYNTKSDTKHTNMNQKKLRVAVLFGGDSNEREISLESGRNIVYKLSPQTYDVLPLFVTPDMKLFAINQSLLVRNSTKEINALLDRATQYTWANLPTLVDFVFIALHGGKGENGSVQGTLEMLGLPYNGSGVLTSALCMDKHKTAELLKTYSIAIPEQFLLEKHEWLENKKNILSTILEQITLPAIVKPHDDGCSMLVEKINTKKELSTAIDAIFADGKTHALIESFITGMELTVGVVGNNNPQALPPSATVVQKDILSIEEKFLPGAGQNITPAPLPKSALTLVQRTIEKTYKAVGCVGYARIDCFYQTAEQSPTGTERVIILEINTLPGMTPATCIFHQAAELGISPMSFVDLIVQLGFAQHAQHNITEHMIHTQHPLLHAVQ